MIVTGIALKLEQFGTTFSSLNPCPFLPSVATDDRNQFQCLKIFLNNKFAALFLGLILGGDRKDPVMDYHTLSRSSQVYKWVAKDLILGRGGRDSCYGLLSRPRESKNIHSRLMLWRSAKWATWLERRLYLPTSVTYFCP